MRVGEVNQGGVAGVKLEIDFSICLQQCQWRKGMKAVLRLPFESRSEASDKRLGKQIPGIHSALKFPYAHSCIRRGEGNFRVTSARPFERGLELEAIIQAKKGHTRNGSINRRKPGVVVKVDCRKAFLRRKTALIALNFRARLIPLT
jgi:hypothetical protein